MSQISYRLSYSYHIYNVVTRNKQKIFWISPTKNELSGKYQWNSVSEDWRVNEAEKDKINWRSEILRFLSRLRCEVRDWQGKPHVPARSTVYLDLSSQGSQKQNKTLLTSTIVMTNFAIYHKKIFPSPTFPSFPVNVCLFINSRAGQLLVLENLQNF